MEIQTCGDTSIAVEGARRAIVDLLTNNIEHSLLLCSGGSAFQILPRELSSDVAQRLTISVLDERLSNDPEINNFIQLKNTDFFKHVTALGTTSIATIPESTDTLETFAEKMTEQITAWALEFPKGKIFSTLGMGPDGHTAGILPYPEDPTLFGMLFDDPSFWVKGYNAKDKHIYPDRVTVTNVFLTKKIESSIAFVVGQEKQVSFLKLNESQDNLAEIPARIWHQMKNVEVFTDIKL